MRPLLRVRHATSTTTRTSRKMAHASENPIAPIGAPRGSFLWPNVYDLEEWKLAYVDACEQDPSDPEERPRNVDLPTGLFCSCRLFCSSTGTDMSSYRPFFLVALACILENSSFNSPTPRQCRFRRTDIHGLFEWRRRKGDLQCCGGYSRWWPRRSPQQVFL